MGKMVTVELNQANTSTPRYFNGYVTAARHAGSNGGLASYVLTVSPWTKLLEHRRDHFIFHNRDLVATLGEIFADYAPFKDVEYLIANLGPTEAFAEVIAHSGRPCMRSRGLGGPLPCLFALYDTICYCCLARARRLDVIFH